ncbi:MAG: oligosaccharide flippase family protein [Fidelibacterota bacterium]|nr:MAG: oligosaccharide flippase family protein [Candidatus Neomarinimicrobiota bacterium]
MTENIDTQDIAPTDPTDKADNQLAMNQDLSRLGRKSLAYVIGYLATRAVSFLLLPLYTNALVPEDMGILSLAFAFSAFGLVFYRLGLDSALLRYYVGEAKERQREVFTTVYLILVVTGLVLSGLVLIFRSPLATSLLGTNHPEWIAILAAIMFFDTLWAIPMHLFRADERPLPYITLSLVNVFITMGLNILLVAHYRMGVEGALLANLAASATLFLVTLISIVRRLSLTTVSTETARRLLRFGLPLLLAGLFTVTLELADRYLLRWLSDLETVGIYSAGYKLGMLMLITVMGFNMGWQPFFLRRGKQEGAQPVFARVTTYMVAIMATLLIITGAWVDDLVRLPLGPITIFGPDYWSSTGIVPIVMLAYLFFGLYVLLLPGIHLSARTHWVILFRGTGAILNVGLNLFLIPAWGAMGAALSTCIGFGAMALVTFFIVKHIYPVRYEWSRLARIALLLALGFVILYGLPPSWWRNLALTILFPAGLWITRVVSLDERDLFRQFLGRA